MHHSDLNAHWYMRVIVLSLLAYILLGYIFYVY